LECLIRINFWTCISISNSDIKIFLRKQSL
jgi:hypothetical protein